MPNRAQCLNQSLLGPVVSYICMYSSIMIACSQLRVAICADNCILGSFRDIQGLINFLQEK